MFDPQTSEILAELENGGKELSYLVDKFEISEDETTKLLSRVPQNLKTQEEIIYADELISGLPEWFKTTASWWAEDKITDSEMMKSVEFLRDAGVIRPR